MEFEKKIVGRICKRRYSNHELIYYTDGFLGPTKLLPLRSGNWNGATTFSRSMLMRGRLQAGDVAKTQNVKCRRL